MIFPGTAAGLNPEFPSPTGSDLIDDVVTEEAAVRAPGGPALHVTPLVEEGEGVARGAAVACLRHTPSLCLVAPIAGQVAKIDLLPGRKLSEIVLFRDPQGRVEHHDTGGAETRLACAGCYNGRSLAMVAAAPLWRDARGGRNPCRHLRHGHRYPPVRP